MWNPHPVSCFTTVDRCWPVCLRPGMICRRRHVCDAHGQVCLVVDYRILTVWATLYASVFIFFVRYFRNLAYFQISIFSLLHHVRFGLLCFWCYTVFHCICFFVFEYYLVLLILTNAFDNACILLLYFCVKFFCRLLLFVLFFILNDVHSFLIYNYHMWVIYILFHLFKLLSICWGSVVLHQCCIKYLLGLCGITSVLY